MTTRELMEWVAYERVAGPILVHDRIDYATTQLSYIAARAAGSKAQPKKFLPPWHRKDTVTTFEQLLRMADADH